MEVLLNPAGYDAQKFKSFSNKSSSNYLNYSDFEHWFSLFQSFQPQHDILVLVVIDQYTAA